MPASAGTSAATSWFCVHVVFCRRVAHSVVQLGCHQVFVVVVREVEILVHLVVTWVVTDGMIVLILERHSVGEVSDAGYDDAQDDQ